MKIKFRFVVRVLVMVLTFISLNLSSVSFSDEIADKKIEDLYRKIIQLENKLALNTAMDNASDDNVTSFVDRVDYSAFMSVGLAKTNKEEGFFPGKISDQWSFQPNTVFGFQMNFKINENFDLVGQLVSRSNSSSGVDRSDWQVESDWAYVSYKATSQLQVRAGRLRLPIYLYSDYLEVGYAYPWISPPTEVYYEDEVTSFEGVDGIYNISLGDAWSVVIQGFFGSLNDVVEREGVTSDFAIRNFTGLNTSISNGDLTFRIGQTQGEQDFCANIPIVMPINPLLPVGLENPNTVRNTKSCFENIDFTFQGLGVRYDAHNVLVVSEVIRYRANSELLAKTQSGYVTFGYNLGNWMPHITFAKTSNFDDDNLAASDKVQQSSITLGSRFNIENNVAFKVEVKRVSDFGETNGQFNGASVFDDEVYVYSAVIDVTF